MIEPERDIPDGPEEQARLRATLEEIDRVYLEQVRKGETPDRGSILASHPGMADSIGEHLDLLDALHRIRRGPALPSGGSPGEAALAPCDVGARVGPYQILGAMGEGGMGIVYLAEQTEPVRRTVALKVLKPGLATDDVIARFESERQALALMEHPGIARIFDGGVTGTGRPYFVMEYVRGIPITEYCDAHRHDTIDRLRLFVEVCHAVQHAHQKGIIHRDLKPSNILVTKTTGKPTSRIIDFGVAKATHGRLADRKAFTEMGRIFGTVGYMSPEQAGGEVGLIDTRTDIYSLGVILYELLVGASPFEEGDLDAASMDEIRRRIRQEDPPRPSTRFAALGQAARRLAEMRRTSPEILARRLRGDLDWITMKAMEKDPARRYASASELAADITRHLRDEPVLAGPPTTWYRLTKFVRKHRVGATAAAAAGVTLIAGLAVSTALYFRAAADRDLAETAVLAAAEQREEARREARRAESISRSFHRLIASANPIHHGGEVDLSDLLDRAVRDIEDAPPDDPLVEASLRRTIGRSYIGLGLYDRAEKSLRRSLEIHRQALGEDHRETVLSRLHWGLGILHRGDVSRASTIFRDALATLRREAGQDDPATLAATHYLGRTASREGKSAEAESLLRQALDGRRRVLGESHQDTLATMEHLADLLHRLGRLDEAEALLRRVIEIREGRHGERHPLLIQTRGSLAILLQDKGKVGEAERTLRQVLNVSGEILGGDHPYTLYWMTNLARLLVARGGLPEGESLSRRVLEAHRRRNGDDHPSTLEALNNLAVVLQNQGKVSEGEALQREALAGQRKALGRDHPGTLRSAGNLGLSLMSQGRFEEAEPLLREAYEGLLRALGEDHPDTWRSGHRLAFFLSRMGAWERAESLYRKVLQAHIRILGEDHPETVHVRDGLGSLLIDRGEHAEAEQLLRGAVDTCLRLFGEADPDTLRVTHDLAVSLRHLGKLEEAEAMARRTAAGLRQALGDGHPDSIESMALLAGLLQDRSDLAAAERLWRRVMKTARSQRPRDAVQMADLHGGYGSCLMAMGRHDDAEEHLLRSYAGMRDAVGPDHFRTQDALRGLIELYRALGESEKVKEYESLLTAASGDADPGG